MGNAQTSQEIQDMESVPSDQVVFADGQVVTTPYGKSTVKSVRDDGMIVVQPLSWELANGGPPTFFMNAKDVKPFVEEELIVPTDEVADVTEEIKEVEVDSEAALPIEEVLLKSEVQSEPTESAAEPSTEETVVEATDVQAEVADDATVTAEDTRVPTEEAVVLTEANSGSTEEEVLQTEVALVPTQEDGTVQPSDEQCVVEAVAEVTEVLSLAEPILSADPVPQAEPAIPVAPQEKEKDDVQIVEPTSPSANETPVSPIRRRGSFSILSELELGLVPEMFLVKPDMEPSADVKDAVLAKGKDLLIGWQIQIKTEIGSGDNGIRVITASKKLALQPTQFSLARSAEDEQKTWSYLKRNDQKTGLEFKLLRKVIEIRT